MKRNLTHIFMIGLFLMLGGCQDNSIDCISIRNNADRDSCYLTASRDLKDKSMCEKIADVDVRNFCLQK